jgi:hypothetical protein
LRADGSELKAEGLNREGTKANPSRAVVSAFVTFVSFCSKIRAVRGLSISGISAISGQTRIAIFRADSAFDALDCHQTKT